MIHRMRDATAVVIALAIGVAAGCATGGDRSADGRLTTGPFAKAERLDSELRRGTSSKSDVERVFGKPNGRGTTLLPTQTAPREVWIYQNVVTGQAKQEGAGAGGVPIVRIDIRQQILLVFFNGDHFDGYLWSNWVQPTKAEPK